MSTLTGLKEALRDTQTATVHVDRVPTCTSPVPSLPAAGSAGPTTASRSSQHIR
jgi:hypothetical protein